MAPRILPTAAGLRRLGGRVQAASRVNRAALAASVVWAIMVLSYAAGYFGGGGQARGTAFLDAVFFLVALTLPIGLVWLAAWLAAELARQRAAVATLVEAAGPLVAALEATRGALEGGGRAVQPDLAPLLRELRAGQETLAERLAALATRVEAAQVPAPAPAPAPAPEPGPPPARPRRPRAMTDAASQPALPLMAPEPEAAALTWAELIRALDFPKDADDREGFRALRRALRHHSLAQMLQAAEDIMNLLSQEGVYMDDLAPEPGAPQDWRAFVEGRRGAEVTGVGGIRDERALEVARGLMKSDPIFRDTALYFQRRFDVVLGEFAAGADDAGLLALADTRSARAFMLCARVSGAFG